MLSEAFLRRRLEREGIENLDLLVLPQTCSTNADCRNAAAARPSRPLLITADTQTAGRGRMGRAFCSPDGGLYMSLLLPVDRPVTAIVGVTSCAAVAVCRAVERTTGVSPGIKWVNDIFLDGGKAAGILCEAVGDGSHARYVIVGIGINCGPCPDVPGAATLASDGRTVEREALCAAVSKELLASAGSGFAFAPLADEYRARCVILGRRITFTRDGIPREGTAEAVDDCGALLVRTDDGTVCRLDSGEISVRLRDGAE